MRLLFPMLLLATSTLPAQRAPTAYQLYDAEGEPVKWKKMLRQLKLADVVLFGELHDNAIGHWLQEEVAADLGDYDLGLEMIETDEQGALDRFLAGELDREGLERESGGMWSNFDADYLPLIRQTIERGGRVIGTNIPRRYAREVFRGGFEALEVYTDTDTAALIAPLPVPYDPELPSYKAMLDMMPAGHGGATFPMAQAIKDATMAHFILENLSSERTFLHLNGSYHSDDYEGIGWYLKTYRPQTMVTTLTTIVGDEFTEAMRGKADFILLVKR